MKNRIIDFAKSQKMSIREFERVCNFPNGTIGAFKDDINNKRRLVIFEKFPQLNTKWLLTGEGEMLNHSHNGTTHNTNTQGDNNIYINNSQNALTDKETQSISVQANENSIYTEMIATQRELIANQNELISQYRKEIEYLRQKVKEYREKYEK